MYIIVFVTAKDFNEAQKISTALVDEKLIACANIIERVKSFFWWEGKVDRADEALLIMKSKRTLFKKIAKRVKALHSYSTPEIIALPLVDGHKDYLRWIDDSLR